jgi:hypothetical protein
LDQLQIGVKRALQHLSIVAVRTYITIQIT